MTRIRLLLAVLLGAALAGEAPAQPVIGIPAVAQNGIDFQIGGKQLRIDGFIPIGNPYGVIVPVTPTPFGLKQVAPAYPTYYGNPYYPAPVYGLVERRVTVQAIPPTTVVVRSRRESYDLSGIDLDVETPDKLWGSKGPKKSELVKAPGAAPKEMAKPMPPEEKKAPVIAANPGKPPPPPPAPKLEKLPEGQVLVDLGIAAFQDGDYNIAIVRFRQAALADPPGPRAVFLQAQATIAVGRYRDAVELIQQELARQPNWPAAGFRPRAELYGNPEAWNAQRERLLAAQKLQPKNADLPFLLGYLSWFDGERDVALDYFQQSRALMADPRWSDMFLKGAAAKAK